MPLIMMCGIPCSGKTTAAQKIKAELETWIQQHPDELAARKLSLQPNVILLNEESLQLNRKEAYANGHEEKKARAALMSAVERHLTKDHVLICDSMNYIKGFRYQLYCITRALGTPHCVVHCGVTPQQAAEWNSSRPEELQYDAAVLDNLCTRFEEPDARNRWDAPLFTLIPDDPIPTQDIVDAVILRKPPPPNLSTVVKPLTETNYMHEMDRTTQEIVDALLEAQKEGRIGDIVVPKAGLKVKLSGRMVTMSELRRLRRQYTNLNKVHTQPDARRVADSFVEYLNTNL
ncbi:kti12, chromatin associated [Gaertneriomyces sp. JEL0708]|nr:kti12, chromatin associated [Gaertneriomyces sp. JEL0708]